MKQRLERWLLNVWYGDGWLGKYLLLPLTALFCLLSAINRWRQKRRQIRHTVPIVVVGNISVGGTGKTPLVIWLVERLRADGFRPGVVSRGHGRNPSPALPLSGKGVKSRETSSFPPEGGGLRGVSSTDAANEVGDEPLLIVQRTGVPLVIGRNRNQAISHLLQQHHCDIVIADDGLQHYQMGRDMEICVVDGQRHFGNGFCLPSGPLREPVSRLASCDFIVTNGENMRMQGDTLINLATNERKPLSEFSGNSAHVVTGIGNPQRFVNALSQAEIHPLLNIYPDHHAFTGHELRFDDALPVLMTEKDAVKCRQFAAQNCWYLPVEAVLDDGFAQALLTRLQGLRHG